jgi:3-oxosteroid 1-dehydrogenase
MVQIADPADLAWDRVVDVVAVGSGAAALSAAVIAADAAISVEVLERADQLGGTTAKSGGAFWIPGNPNMELAGVTESLEDCIRYVARLAYPQSYCADAAHLGLPEADYELIATYCHRAAEALDALRRTEALHIRMHDPNGGRRLNPDYHSDMPENNGILGRSVGPIWPEGEDLPDELRTGPWELAGGMIMIETMRRATVARGVSIRLRHRVTDVVQDADGRVIGVVARVGRQLTLVGARHGVVFGSGGFIQNPQMSEAYLRGPVFGGCGVATNEGDLVAIGTQVGAAFGNMTQAWWDQVILEQALRHRATTEDIWFPYGDSMLQVNKYGRRVVNEKQAYNERGQAHHTWNASRREYSNLLLFQIYDDVVAQNPTQSYYRGQTPLPGEEVDCVISAPTLDALAAKVDARLAELATQIAGVRLDASFAANLKDTIGRFNAFAVAGTDEDFLRGESPLQHNRGVAQNGDHRGADEYPNPCLAPLSETGPYHCIIVAGGALDTKGGPRIDTNAQILSVTGEPIRGLYGAGNCISCPIGQAYPGSGGTIGPALTFGYIAGRSVAAADPIDL